MIEVRVRGVSKALAAAHVPSPDETSGVIAFGDDHTDEDAFDAMRGRGLSVLVRPELRDTGADIWLRPPHELVSFLQHWCDCCGVAA